MFQKLVSHNEDLQRLLEKGYAVAFYSNCLVIRDIPYVNENRQLRIGAIVAKLQFVNNEQFLQTDHQIFFAGSVPYGLDGKPIPNFGGGPHTLQLSPNCSDVVVERSFSNKPRAGGKYRDHFHKIETYVGFISGPATELFGATPYTFKTYDESINTSVFKFHDTLTTRAEIGDLAIKLNPDTLAIIGLGGTGAYLLDFLVKSPVHEIRGYDHDDYYVHNAYRSPGRMNENELGRSKASIYQDRYTNFRHNLKLETKYIDASSYSELDGVTFAFVCVDSGLARAEIINILIEMKIPFIDVGMGLHRKNDALNGMLRVTYFPAEYASNVRNKQWVNEKEDEENLYKANIQISELNALNACLAVIRYKQIRGYYCGNDEILNALFNISTLSTMRENSLD